jgi:hypothetical protein
MRRKTSDPQGILLGGRIDGGFGRMPVDWKQFHEELAEWEKSASHERFMRLCNALERSIRRAFRTDGLLDFQEVTAALDCIAEEVVRMRRDAEGRKPCERVAVELAPGLAERLRDTALREGLEVSDLVAALIDRQLLSPEPVRARGRGKRRASREE